MKKISKLLIALLFYNIQANDLCNGCEGDSGIVPTIFVPRQLSYNPILENALTFARLKHDLNNWCFFFSAKPIYTQSVGCKFNNYFNIDHKNVLSVREDGSGDIDSLWFKVISSDDSFYSSDIAFHPKRKTYGSLFFFEFSLPCNFWLSLNTAVVTASNSMNLCERDIKNKGTTKYETVTESISSLDRDYSRVANCVKKTGLDDIQLKLIKNVCNNSAALLDVYLLVGIPTGKGSKADYLFEPLVGSKHAQIGLGSYFFRDVCEYECGNLSFQAEVKWRYAFSAHERRIFDLRENGSWSRYLLFVEEEDKYLPFFNEGIWRGAKITPRNSLDIYLALNGSNNNFNFELGYDFWFRNAEKIKLATCSNVTTDVGIADLLGMAKLDAQTASTASISQSVEPGDNQMVSDESFITFKKSDLSLCSGRAPRSISNSIYGSLAYNSEVCCNPLQIGLSAAYEIGSNINVPNNVFVWLNLDFEF